jgi:hypothetical protein
VPMHSYACCSPAGSRKRVGRGAKSLRRTDAVRAVLEDEHEHPVARQGGDGIGRPQFDSRPGFGSGPVVRAGGPRAT